MKINNHIILDFNKTKQVDTQTIQCDMNSRFVRVSLRHNNSPIDLSDVRVCIMAVKPDGKEIFNDCTVIDAQNGIAEFEITKQMGIVVGEVECQIKLFGKEKLLSSNIFNLSVSKSLSPNSRDSKDQLNTLVNTLGEVQDIDNRFNKTNYKIDENYQKVNAQLSDIDSKLQNTVFINQFYIDDFTVALKEALNVPNVKKIVVDGVYDVKSSAKFLNLSGVEISGKCSLNLLDNFDTLYEFYSCHDVIVKGLRINGNNFSNYISLFFNECENIVIDELSIENIHNTDVEKETNNIRIYAKNSKIANISFKNIIHTFLPENEKTGKGAITNIYFLIDKVYRIGEVQNIFAEECHNVNGSNEIIMGDVDTIKTQYVGGISNNYIDSMLSISNVKGINFGKRMIKLQTGGCTVANINGETSTNDTFSLIGIHHKNVKVNNISMKSDNYSANCMVELAMYVENIDISNVTAYGSYKSRLLVLRAQYIEKGKNIKFSNVNLIIDDAEGSIYFLSSFDNVEFYKIFASGNFTYNDTNFIGKSHSVTELTNIKFNDCKFEMTALSFINLSTSPLEKIDIYFNNLELNLTYAKSSTDSTRMLNISPSVYGKMAIVNSNIAIKNQNYKYGWFRISNFNSVLLSNVCVENCEGKYFASITSNNVRLDNLRVDGGNVEVVSDLLSCNTVTADNIKIKNSNDDIISKVNVNDFSGVLIQEPTSLGKINVSSSDLITHSEVVNLTSGRAELIIDFPQRMYSVKFINFYAKNRDNTKIILTSHTQYTATFRILENDYTGPVECVITYCL